MRKQNKSYYKKVIEKLLKKNNIENFKVKIPYLKDVIHKGCNGAWIDRDVKIEFLHRGGLIVGELKVKGRVEKLKVYVNLNKAIKLGLKLEYDTDSKKIRGRVSNNEPIASLAKKLQDFVDKVLTDNYEGYLNI